MIEALAQVAATLDGLLWHVILVACRVLALVGLCPGFGETAVPMRVKLAISLAVSAAVFPMVPPLATLPSGIGILFLLVVEVATGAAMGLTLRLFTLCLQTAGMLAAQMMSLAQITGIGAEASPAVAQLLLVSGLALMMVMGFPVLVVAYVIEGYQAFPIGGAGRTAWADMPSLVHASFSLSFALAAPFLIVGVVYNLALGVINRAMPQLMVAFVGAPLATLGGLVMLLLLTPLLLGFWWAQFQGHLISGVWPR